MAQAGFEDRLRLCLGQLEALHQDRLRLVLAADDADDLVQVQERGQQAVENVQPGLDALEAVLQAPAHGFGAELEPLLEQLLQVVHPRPAVETDHVQVHAIAALKIGGGEQVRHQLHRVHTVGARHDHQARRVLVVGLVAQVFDHGQLFLLHLLRDLLDHLRA